MLTVNSGTGIFSTPATILKVRDIINFQEPSQQFEGFWFSESPWVESGPL